MKRMPVPLGVLLAVGLAATVAAAGGQLDPGFGERGIVVSATGPGAASDWQNGLVVTADRSIIVGGSSDMGVGGHQFRVTQLTKTGELDPSFGVGGTALTSVSSLGGTDEHIWDIARQSDGRIVAVGEARFPGAGGDNFALARYTSTGVLDTTFGGDGVVVSALATGENRDNALAVALQADGKIVAAGGIRMGAGNTNNDIVVARYNVDGTLDSSFGGDGVVTTAVGPGTRNDAATGVAIQSDGKIVVGGQADMGPGAGRTNFAFARYNADGSLDATFDGDGVVTTAVAVGDGFDTAWSFALLPDGKILGAGNALMASGLFEIALARYNADGSLDATFDGDGIATSPLAEGDADVWAVVIDSVGRIVVAGDAVGPDFFDSWVARFDSTGTLDSSFGAGGIAVTPTAPDGGYDAFYEVGLDKTGKIIASGECDQPTTGTDVCVARFKAGDD